MEEINLEMNKKLFSLILCLVLAISLLTVPAGASGGNETEIIPSASVTSVTPTTITVKEIGSVQYRIDGGAWTTASVFSGLYPNTAYTIDALYTTTNSVRNLGTYTTKASESHTGETLIDSAAPNTLAYTEYSTAYSLNNDLTYHLYLKASKVSNYTNLRIYVEQFKYENNNSSAGTWVGTVIPASSGTVFINNAERYDFAIPNLSAKMLGDALNITLYADRVSDGKTFITPLFETGLKQTAYNILSGNEATAKKRVAADLIKYCAAAQKYFGYNITNLVDSGLSAYSSYVSANGTLNRLHNVVTERADATVSISGYDLILDSRITWAISFDINDAAINASALRLKATYTTSQGETKNLTLAPSSKTGATVVFSLSQIAAGDFSSPVNFTVYSGSTPVSSTYQSNIEHRAQNLANTDNTSEKKLYNLMHAMMNYSRSANAFFSQGN